NYLLNAHALADELNEETRKHQLPQVQINKIAEWIETHAVAWCDQQFKNYSLECSDWQIRVNAAGLLNALFQEFGKTEYRKTSHSPSLTRRLLSARESTIGELVS